MTLAAIILDALDADNLRKLDMPFLQSLYEQQGQVLTCSTFPVTHSSNPMIWGGIEDNDLHWLEHETAEPPYNPARFWQEEDGRLTDGARFYTREDYNTSFIWDDLEAEGYDARALEIPIVMPPYSFNVDQSLEECWFPANKQQMKNHTRSMIRLIRQNMEDGCDFIAASIHVPDAWFHKIGEGKTDIEWVKKESRKLDNMLQDLVQWMQDNNIDYMFFGDHGSPQEGQAIDGDYILTRHRKESVLISNMDADLPRYTEQMYPFMLDYFDIIPASVEDVAADDTAYTAEEEQQVKERLEQLGYI